MISNRKQKIIIQNLLFRLVKDNLRPKFEVPF